MPIISPESGHLTVINLFSTDTPEKQDRLLGAMREIVDAAAYDGWISSTMHSGQDKYGTANYIQWRSGEDLEARYAGEEFKHRTVPLFTEMTTSIKLLQTEVAFTQRRPGLGDATEISPERGDYTVIEVFGVAPEHQDELIAALGESQDWLLDTPGYRSHTVLRGLRARGFDGLFAVVYSQWDDKKSYDAFRAQPESEQPSGRQKTQAQLDALVTYSEWNTYRPVHSRSAGQ
ncbi:MAG TPA: antibiotic biosynthesis monooxygenase family protein [Streptosporangiaceae bacterium]|jgi:heme-degrading monooxygenase HmoA